MENTITLARSFGTTPFEIMDRDTDEVIMVLAYYVEKGDEEPEEARPAPSANAPRQGKFDGFWDF